MNPKSHVYPDHLDLVLTLGRDLDRDLYHRWIFFDDLWAAAHPELAKAILTYAGRWDVLS